MVAIVGEAGVKLRPEASGFAKEADAQVSDELPGVAKKAAGFFAAAFAVVGIGAFVKNAVSDASDLSESASKVGVVFGDASQQVLDFAANASSAFGQSKGQALEAAGTFGNLLRSIGLTEQASADMSTRMVGLASDLASFNNTDPAEALEALRSGLTGETEPLKRYGINLNDAALKQEALRLGLDASGATLSANTKAQAAYSLIMQQSSLAQGDFLRTSAGLANQQRIMSAQWTDLSANIGGLFVPLLGIASGAITSGLMPALLHATSGLSDLGNRAADSLTQAKDAAANFGGIFGEAMADGKAGADLLAQDSLGGLAARAGVAAFRIRQDLGAAFLSVQAAVAPQLAHLFDAIRPALDTVKAAIGQMFAGLGGGGGGGGLAGFAAMIGGALNQVVPIITDFLSHWIGIVQSFLPVIMQVVMALVPVVQQVFAQIGPILTQLMPIISTLAGLWRDALLTAIQALLPVLPPIIAAIGQVVGILGGALTTVIQQLAPIIPQLAATIAQLAGTFGQTLGGVLQALAPVLPVLARAFAAIAVAIGGALSSLLSALLPILPPLAEAFGQIAVALAGALAQALQAIIPILPTLIDALLQLVMAAIMPLLPILPLLAQLLVTVIQALTPLIPPIIQIIMLIIQLAVAALGPMMTILPIFMGLIRLLLAVLTPIISVVGGIIGAFIGLVSTVIGLVVGFVSTLIGIWTSLWNGISSLVTKIVSGVTGGFKGLVSGVKSIFSGIADFVGGMFEGIGGAIKGAINGIISGINATVIAGVNLVIDGVNKVNPFDDIPHVPNIPQFHEGGVFDAPTAGLALLRPQELIATPEQRVVADSLLRDLLAGDLSAGAPGASSPPPIVINETVHAAPGQSEASIAARVTQGVVWNLNNGITRRVGAAALEPA